MRGFCIEVTGDYACFTRPEMKVERVSYDIITPSAARGIFQAIFWKPAINWRITRIDVLNPITWMTVRRNEINDVASERNTGINIEDNRQQRAALLLKNVRYRLYAEFDYIPPQQRAKVLHHTPEWLSDDAEHQLLAKNEDRQDECEAKYAAIFERRAKKGQYFMHPYLGTREFSCKEVLLVNQADVSQPTPIVETRDFGYMLYDMDYSDPTNIRPMFFRAKMINGVVIIPSPNSQEVYK